MGNFIGAACLGLWLAPLLIAGGLLVRLLIRDMLGYKPPIVGD